MLTYKLIYKLNISFYFFISSPSNLNEAQCDFPNFDSGFTVEIIFLNKATSALSNMFPFKSYILFPDKFTESVSCSLL